MKNYPNLDFNRRWVRRSSIIWCCCYYESKKYCLMEEIYIRVTFNIKNHRFRMYFFLNLNLRILLVTQVSFLKITPSTDCLYEIHIDFQTFKITIILPSCIIIKIIRMYGNFCCLMEFLILFEGRSNYYVIHHRLTQF